MVLGMDEVILSGMEYQSVDIRTYRYVTSGGIALVLYSEQNERLATATVNLEDYGKEPAEGCVWIKDYGTTAGLAQQLEEYGIGRLTGVKARFGPYGASALEMRLAAEVVADAMKCETQ